MRKRGRPKIYIDNVPPSATEESKHSIKVHTGTGNDQPQNTNSTNLNPVPPPSYREEGEAGKGISWLHRFITKRAKREAGRAVSVRV